MYFRGLFCQKSINSTDEALRSDEGLTQKRQLSKSFTVVIQPLSTRLIKPNFCINSTHWIIILMLIIVRLTSKIVIELHLPAHRQALDALLAEDDVFDNSSDKAQTFAATLCDVTSNSLVEKHANEKDKER